MNKKGLLKIINSILKIISYFALALLFIVAVILVFYIVTNQVARINKTQPIVGLYTIVSPSMEPTINVYDVILEFKVDDENNLKVGDIITFYSDIIDTGGYTVTHRIKDIKETEDGKCYITKGDNNQSDDDGCITFDHIVGRVEYVFPKLGKVQFFLSSKIGWICVILIPAIGIIVMDLLKINKIIKIKKEIEVIPKIKEIEKVREQEDNKKVRALIEKADRINKK